MARELTELIHKALLELEEREEKTQRTLSSRAMASIISGQVEEDLRLRISDAVLEMLYPCEDQSEDQSHD